MTGKLISTNNNKVIELERDEKLSFSMFLDGQSEKTVNLERVIGIGGEGIVLAHKMDTRENHHKKGWEEKKGRDVVPKFAKFETKNYVDFLGIQENWDGNCGGINEDGKLVNSQYFVIMGNLGDFKAATFPTGGYSRPYIDFGMSEIHQKYYYVIG